MVQLINFWSVLFLYFFLKKNASTKITGYYKRPIDAVPEQSPSLAAAGSTRERRPPASQPFDEMPEPCKPAERSAATRESVRMQLRLGRNKQWRGVHP
jgi:hypothetical protein